MGKEADGGIHCLFWRVMSRRFEIERGKRWEYLGDVRVVGTTEEEVTPVDTSVLSALYDY